MTLRFTYSSADTAGSTKLIYMHRMTSQLQCVSNSKGGIAILKISIAIHNRNAHMTGMCIDITF